MAVIQTVDLRKDYRGFEALKGINLEIEQSDIYGFIGPNGAGKTTTIRILSTLLAPSGGAAFVKGMDVTKQPYDIKRIVGYMPDYFGVYDGMRLREYLDFFGAAYKIPVKRRRGIIDDVLELTDLTSRADDFVSAFSRGLKQRCCLAKTLIHDPEILLLDEPASGLDPRARLEIKELLKTLRDMGKTILISSHILSELSDMCNKIAIIERGQLLVSGDYRQILDSIRSTRVLRIQVLDGADGAETALRETPGIASVQRTGDEFLVETPYTRARFGEILQHLLQRGVQVVGFSEKEGTLEEVFLHVTRGGV